MAQSTMTSRKPFVSSDIETPSQAAVSRLRSTRTGARESMLADEDGMLRAIGRVRRLMLVIEQQRRLTRLQVADLHAIREARFGIYRVPPDTLLAQRLIRQPDQVLEDAGVDPLKAKRHADLLLLRER
jgi:hypothetical protein